MGGGGGTDTHITNMNAHHYLYILCIYTNTYMNPYTRIYTSSHTHACMLANIHTHTSSIIVYKGKGYVHAYPHTPPPTTVSTPPPPIALQLYPTHACIHTPPHPHSLPITVHKGKGVRACTPTPLLPLQVQFTSD